MSDPEYAEIPVPDDKDPEDYHYTERRAEILKLINKKGHTWGFGYRQLGDRYGVSHVQIKKDFDRLKEYIGNRVGKKAVTVTQTAYVKMIREHLDNERYEEARRAIKDWNEWLQTTGHQETEPEQVNVNLIDQALEEVDESEE